MSTLFYRKLKLHSRSIQSEQPQAISTSISQIAPNITTSREGYVLIEFMDYQCPPCRASQGRLNEVLGKYGAKLQFVAKHYPLEMHQNAFNAAVAAEAARDQDKFHQMHKALLAGNSLNPEEIQTISRQIGLDKNRFKLSIQGNALRRVKADMKIAEDLHLDSTPSWLLCTPEGKIWHLKSLAQVQELIK